MVNHKENFKKVLKLVKKGQTIENACKTIPYSKTTLYTNMNEKQKIKLQWAKTLNSNGLSPEMINSKYDLDFFELNIFD